MESAAARRPGPEEVSPCARCTSLAVPAPVSDSVRCAAVAALAAAAFAGGLGPVTAADGAGGPSPRDPSLQRQLQELVSASGGPPGAIAVLQRDGHREVYRAGVAEIGSRRAPGIDDHMRIASVATVALMAEQATGRRYEDLLAQLRTTEENFVCRLLWRALTDTSRHPDDRGAGHGPASRDPGDPVRGRRTPFAAAGHGCLVRGGGRLLAGYGTAAPVPARPCCRRTHACRGHALGESSRRGSVAARPG
ncbi:hypothetical protein AB0I68_25990 [Streptomyces sp. NPDC050448]|uniref:hypothetical protein n=1 Tax=Streptomyces sp. NPDC050448 TaxID=3155404 RepID=UPI003415FAD2